MLNCLERYCLYSPVFSGTQVSVHIVSNTCEDCTRHSVVPQRFGPPPSSGGWPKLTLFHCVFRYGGEVQLQRQDLFLPVTHLWSTTQGGGPLESSICLKASMLHMRLSFFTDSRSTSAAWWMDICFEWFVGEYSLCCQERHPARSTLASCSLLCQSTQCWQHCSTPRGSCWHCFWQQPAVLTFGG